MTNSAITHYGTVLSVIGDKFTSLCTDGKTHHHTLAKGFKVTCDGNACDVADLKAGTPIRVATQKDAPMVATAVESGKHINAPATASGHKA